MPTSIPSQTGSQTVRVSTKKKLLTLSRLYSSERNLHQHSVATTIVRFCSFILSDKNFVSKDKSQVTKYKLDKKI